MHIKPNGDIIKINVSSFVSSRGKVWLHANDSGGKGAGCEEGGGGGGMGKREEHKIRNKKYKWRDRGLMKGKQGNYTARDRAEREERKGDKASSDRCRRKTTKSNSIKVRLSDGVCQMLSFEPDHTNIPRSSTVAHQTHVTNDCVRGWAPPLCMWAKGRQWKDESDRRERRRRTCEGCSTSEREREQGWCLPCSEETENPFVSAWNIITQRCDLNAYLQEPACENKRLTEGTRWGILPTRSHFLCDLKMVWNRSLTSTAVVWQRKLWNTTLFLSGKRTHPTKNSEEI